MANTGRKIYPFLRQVDTTTMLPTGLKKANVPEDVNYVQPVINYTACPIQAWQAVDPFCVVASGCQEGWTLNLEGTACLQNQNMASTPPTTPGEVPSLVEKVTDIQWNNGGARLYASGFSVNGSGTVLDALTTPHLWVNGDSPFDALTRNLIDSRMNASAVWSVNVTPVNEYIGFSKKITLVSPKTYYLGISVDNKVKVILNGVVVLDFTLTDGGPNFNYWNIYPITLPQGENFLEILGANASPGIAGIGAELYDMTRAELQAATIEADLDVAYSTAEHIGQSLHIGSTQAYSCPEGWSLDVTVGGAPVCKRTLSQAPTTSNTGMKGFTNRIRLTNGVPDGFTELNQDGIGIGPYFAPVQDLINCPT